MRKLLIVPLAGLAAAASAPANAQDIGGILSTVLTGGQQVYAQPYQPTYGYEQPYAYQPGYGYQAPYGYAPAYGYQQTYGYRPAYVYSRPRYVTYRYRRPAAYGYGRYRHAAYRHHARRHHHRAYAYWG